MWINFEILPYSKTFLKFSFCFFSDSNSTENMTDTDAHKVLNSLKKMYKLKLSKGSCWASPSSLRALLDSQDEDGDTALHIAARQGAEEIVRWLINESVDGTLRSVVIFIFFPFFIPN